MGERRWSVRLGGSKEIKDWSVLETITMKAMTHNSQ